MKQLLIQFVLLLCCPIYAAQGTQPSPSQVMQDMESWHQKWLADDRAISEQFRIYGTDIPLFKAKGLDRPTKIAELKAKRAVQDATYSKEVCVTLANAQSLKTQLRRGSAITTEDQEADVIFAKSAKGTPIQFKDMHQLMLYMRTIAQ